jgi:hypothetical protein
MSKDFTPGDQPIVPGIGEVGKSVMARNLLSLALITANRR